MQNCVHLKYQGNDWSAKMNRETEAYSRWTTVPDSPLENFFKIHIFWIFPYTPLQLLQRVKSKKHILWFPLRFLFPMHRIKANAGNLAESAFARRSREPKTCNEI